MAYKNEIEKCVNGRVNRDFMSYKISLMNNVTIVEGVKALLVCDSCVIRIKLKTCIACINGQDLCIAECQQTQITVCGKVDSVIFE